VKVVRKVKKILKGSRVFLHKKFFLMVCKVGLHKKPSEIMYYEEYDPVGICPSCHREVIQTLHRIWVTF
jgi:hypothetical protein